MSGVPLPPPQPGELPSEYAPSADADAVVKARVERPRVRAASVLVLIGASMVMAGAVLPWLEDNSYRLTGTRTFWGRQNNGWREVIAPGRFMIVLAVVVGVVGLVLLVMNRVVAVAVLGVIMSTISFFFNLACLSVVNDTQEKLQAGNIGPGVPIAIVGAAAALAGSILATARRRRAAPEGDAAPDGTFAAE
jgi:hypothetical protein